MSLTVHEFVGWFELMKHSLRKFVLAGIKHSIFTSENYDADANR